MHEHEVTIRGSANVELHIIYTGINCRLDCRQRILRVFQMFASMGTCENGSRRSLRLTLQSTQHCHAKDRTHGCGEEHPEQDSHIVDCTRDMLLPDDKPVKSARPSRPIYT